ncbi:hypothetical protein GGU11DRAFT_101012 [Lentinula aff. detonsa]|nr:hypothetical protein GGU11DRAFT_101012 [Lentinula aff. detonsa]
MNWLNKVGFKLRKVMKGVYVDGHEREDVVESRKEFIQTLETEIFPNCFTYTGNELEVEHLPVLKTGVKIHRVIFQDECCCHANDQCNYVWQEEGVQPLRDKSRGRIVHTSDFILEACGYLKLTPEEIAEQMKLPEEPCALSPTAQPSNSNNATKGKDKGRDWLQPQPTQPGTSYRIRSFEARRIIYPGANYDPWWDMKQLLAQVKDTIQIFDVKFPGDVAVFVFDCSSAHESFSEDSLRANKMNRGPGGVQPKMHDTIIPSGPFAGYTQKMTFPLNSTEVDTKGESVAGKPKV